MSYNTQELSVLAYANGFTLWHYRSKQPLAQITTSGFFTPATDMLRDGDLILANHALSDGQVGASLLRVGADAKGDVKAIALVGGKSG